MLDELRRAYRPQVPKLLEQRDRVVFTPQPPLTVTPQIQSLFPHLLNGSPSQLTMGEQRRLVPLKVGVVFSGGPAPGGHNVLAALFDAGCQLVGFINGPEGVVSGNRVELTREQIDRYRNLGGFDLIGTGRLKIETEAQLEAALKAVAGLDGVVVVGGDDSNTNAAYLADYFLAHNSPVRVVGIPKTIDGDLQNSFVPISFGFDTATKIYSEMIGNIALDALSSRKYYHFIKLMGRSASHVTLECSLKTHPNLTLISEERRTLPQITTRIADLIEKRAGLGKNYGVILIPEGVVETLDLPPHTLDPHGNVNVSAIETEQLLIQTVTAELLRRRYHGKFNGVPHFLGYEGRCGFPSNFDATYCYALGLTAALLISHQQTAVMACVNNLRAAVVDWIPGAVPLITQMTLVQRAGKERAVIGKTVVNLQGKPYRLLDDAWGLNDHYQSPGPIQFFGHPTLTDSIPLIIS